MDLTLQDEFNGISHIQLYSRVRHVPDTETYATREQPVL